VAFFGINSHAHIDAAVFAALLRFPTYVVKWIFGLKVPDFVFVLPTFLAVFIVLYTILWVVFILLWSRK
jgi:hypothetical protein